jgi:hypothetical protein
MQDSFILFSFFGVALAAVGGGLTGWLGAVVVAQVTRWERRISALMRIGDHEPPSRTTLPAPRPRAH